MNSVAEDYAREIDHWARVYGGHGWMIAPADLYQGEHRDEKEFRSLRGVSWKDDATGSRRKLSRWFNPETGEHAGTGIMANCETSNVVLIDLDTKNGKDGVAEWEELQQRYGAAPTPFTVTTPSGGKHLYYRQPENGPRINGKPGKERSGIAAGIDIKADSDAGAFLPPTIIKGSEGRRYQWDSFSGPTDIPRASELPEAPSWIHQA
ncbi:bifunctional DNA primase/polymerase, partial [Frankia sp. EI5c]|uniref:bifunctional DNA primase/polymerase n=1 Tax=Frankia sp. EI5c TaxID=683316 RepID=UPI001F5B255D